MRGGFAGQPFPPTSLRARPASDVLPSALELIPTFGIVGVEDATQQDFLRVPVWFSHRPDGLTRRRHAGKGLSAHDAQLGALMEAVEFAVCERTDRCESMAQPLGEILRELGGLPLADLAPRVGIQPALEEVLAVDECEDLSTGRQARIPAELTRLRVPGAKATWFGSTSNGLASGCSLEDASLHALFELLERDTLALDHVAPSARWIDPASLPPPLDAWQAEWSRRGVLLRVRLLPNAFGLPCFEAQIDEGAGRHLGWGLHTDRRIAVNRAVTEAAQSRLYALTGGGGTIAAAAAERVAARMRWDEVPEIQGTDIVELLDTVIQRLRDAGLTRVLRRRLDTLPGAGDLHGFHVVRLVVPGLESAVPGPLRIGRRLAARLLQAATE